MKYSVVTIFKNNVYIMIDEFAFSTFHHVLNRFTFTLAIQYQTSKTSQGHLPLVEV